MATTTKKPVKKAVVKKQAVKKSPVKKSDDRGNKLTSLTFTVYENGVATDGEVNPRQLHTIIEVAKRLMDDTLRQSMRNALKQLSAASSKPQVKKGK